MSFTAVGRLPYLREIRRERQIAMAALAGLAAQAALDQPAGVLSSRRLRDPHVAREFRGRPRLSVNEREQHRGATGIGEHASDGLGPTSSAWTLGRTVVLGWEATSQTLANPEREGECVINYPHADRWEQVEAIATLTGHNPPALDKAGQFTYAADKRAPGRRARPSMPCKGRTAPRSGLWSLCAPYLHRPGDR